MTSINSLQAAGEANASDQISRPYILQPQESIATVAAKTGVSQEALLSLNPHVDIPELIGPGDTILIPINAKTNDIGSLSSQELHSAASSNTSNEPTMVVTPDPEPEPDWPDFPDFPNDPDPDWGGGGGVPAPAPGDPTIVDLPPVIASLGLGAEVNEIIKKSEYLANLIGIVLDSGEPKTTIVYGEASIYHPTTNQIVIKQHENPLKIIEDLTHEIGHTIYHEVDWSSKEALINSGIANEALAQAASLHVRGQLEQSGLYIDISTSAPSNMDLYIQAYADYQLATGDFLTEFGNFSRELYDIVRDHERTGGLTYTEYYGNAWDERHGD